MGPQAFQYSTIFRIQRTSSNFILLKENFSKIKLVVKQMHLKRMRSVYQTDYCKEISRKQSITISPVSLENESFENELLESCKVLYTKKRDKILPPLPSSRQGSSKSFWSMEYYQKFFDVDTKDVLDRILASVTPKWDNNLKHHLRAKPDLYGPFWISVTLVFTIAISSNIANYLQHANETYHWRYDFHLVSYAATTIFLYVTLVPSILWGLLKWSMQVHNIEGLDEDMSPGALELICVYGYSLFIYIPVSVLWSIQISLMQWILVLLGTFISGSVLLLTLMPALRLSRHKLLLCLGIIFCHLLLAAGFKLYFFHDPSSKVVILETTKAVTEAVHSNLTLVSTKPKE
nr:protein YIPF1 isoform X2 [Leptinotarsa decemlineata]